MGRADYERFKLFQLSVLWRAHVATQKIFARVDLGKRHAARIRQMLLDNDPGGPDDYPCALSAVSLDGEQRRDIIAPVFWYSGGGHHFFVFVFAGLKWIYVVSAHAGRHWIADRAIQADGHFVVRGYELRGSELARFLLGEVFLPNLGNVARMRGKASNEASRH